MNFHEVRFPADLSLGASGGPERRTEIVAMQSGFEERNTPWSQSRRRFDAGIALRSMDDLEVVIGFFEARLARVFGFRWKDWSDCKSCSVSQEPEFSDQDIFVGDSATHTVQLIKNYLSGNVTHSRAVTKPVIGTVTVGVAGHEVFEGTDYTVDHSTGVITFAEAPSEGAVVTAGYEFDVPVRFDTDFLDVNVGSFMAGSVPSIPVIEVRV